MLMRNSFFLCYTYNTNTKPTDKKKMVSSLQQCFSLQFFKVNTLFSNFKNKNAFMFTPRNVNITLFLPLP